MLTLYFSGTGNTKYIAKKVSKKLNADCHSIEENIDFISVLKKHDSICVCYPIYASRVPFIFQEFVRKYKNYFKNKQIIILVTQAMFSGDGARAFTNLFPKNYFNVIYAEHLFMPNNICNFSLFPVKNGKTNRHIIIRANKKINKICFDIVNGIIIKRGFNIVSQFIGLSQGLYAEFLLNKGKSSVTVDKDCTGCGACVKVCPMSNLILKDKNIVSNNNCTICYRCVNLCPKKAITVFINKKPKNQYHGCVNIR